MVFEMSGRFGFAVPGFYLDLGRLRPPLFIATCCRADLKVAPAPANLVLNIAFPGRFQVTFLAKATAAKPTTEEA
jgi:hypothetical protein